MTKIRVFESFSGYGAQSLALERLKRNNPDFSYEVVGVSEIDKYAIKAYNALHGETKNYGDITQIDWTQVPDFDLFTYSSPCTNFSSLGNKKGGEKNSGTTSSLLWECETAIRVKKPKYMLMENVSDIKKRRFLSTLHKWMSTLKSMGYSNHAFIANSQDFGVPQDRNRLFMVSILGEDTAFYEPRKISKSTDISNILDKDPKSFARTPEKIESMFKGRLFESPVIVPRTHGYLKPIPRKICPALTTTCGGDYFVFFPNGYSRGITTSEAFRLMGLSECEICLLENSEIPKTKLFKLAGNSIVVNVLESVFERMFIANKAHQDEQLKIF